MVELENKEIVAKIIEGIQEKKGKNIVVCDFNKLKDAPCSYFVICEGDSNVHVNTITSSIADWVLKEANYKPYAVDGLEYCHWVAMDYAQIIVHIFQQPFRSFYDLEHLWEDADLKIIPNID